MWASTALGDFMSQVGYLGTGWQGSVSSLEFVIRKLQSEESGMGQAMGQD